MVNEMIQIFLYVGFLLNSYELSPFSVCLIVRVLAGLAVSL